MCKGSLLGREASFRRSVTFSRFLTDHLRAQLWLVSAKVGMVKGTGICAPSRLAKTPEDGQDGNEKLGEKWKHEDMTSTIEDHSNKRSHSPSVQFPCEGRILGAAARVYWREVPR